MHEASFMKGLVEEIKRSKDPRFKAINEWCLKIAREMQSCGGDAEKQELHVAVITWELLVGISSLEESLSPNMLALAATFTICNEDDLLAPQYSLRIDFDKKMIVISVKPLRVSLLVLADSSGNDCNITLKSLAVPLTPTVQDYIEARKEARKELA